MNNNAVDRYCKRVGKLLICSAETRQELLDGLRGELVELPPEQSDSVKKLENCYGKISETAVSLQDAVPPDERASALTLQQKMKITVCAATAAIFILFAAFVCYLEISRPVKIVVHPPVEVAGTVSADIPHVSANK